MLSTESDVPSVDAAAVARLLLASSFGQAHAAARAISHGDLSVGAAFDVVAGDLARVYRIRLENLRSKQSPHAQQLAASVAELCDSLRTFSGAACWLSVPGTRPADFLILIAADGSRVLGCMLTVSQLDVTSAEWAQLWDDGRHALSMQATGREPELSARSALASQLPPIDRDVGCIAPWCHQRTG